MRPTCHNTPNARRLSIKVGLLLIGFTLYQPALEPVDAAPPTLDFNRDIRPILAENCFYCHGQDANKRQADLRLDLRDAAIEAGAIVPRDAGASELSLRINSLDSNKIMPPRKSNRLLSESQKKLLDRWITEGAVYTTHWAFAAPHRPALPSVRRVDWVRNPIDRFTLEKLESEGLSPSPEADRATLIKRLSIDLLGVPPTLEDVEEFVSDSDPGAYEKLVDRLLSSPNYGERMALPWLDAARYADSNGFQQDGDTWQWIWRDWLVRALNQDMPFDQFTIWQLAGDLLPNSTTDQKIASGFNRNHLLNGEGGAIAEEQRFVNLFDRVDTTATTWLGLTMACAQCHDHKYDPITQHDYYGLLDAFNRVPESGTPEYTSSRIRVASPYIEVLSQENKARIAKFQAQIMDADRESKLSIDSAYQDWRAGLDSEGNSRLETGLPDALSSILRKPAGSWTVSEKNSVEAGLRRYFEEKVKPGLIAKLPAIAKLDGLKKQLTEYQRDKIPRVMVMSDARPRQSAILARGEYLKPTEKVSFSTPKFLPPLPSGSPMNRLGLARWLVSHEHPLTARVQVNRMWQHFFGTGIVKTSEDFGTQSEYPTHLALLDWLAVEYPSRGWSTKAMQRLILTSATYRQSSRVTPEHRGHDIENRLYSRSSRFRMPSLILRDWALAAAGLLDRRIGGVPVYPYQPDAIWEALAITKERDFTYPASSGDDLYRRGIYTFWRRTVSPANMFDSSNRQACRVRLTTTSTPLHALTTLNDPTWVEAARMLAQKSMKAAKDLDGQISFAFRRVLCRKPTSHELAVLRRAFQKQSSMFRAGKGNSEEFLNVGAASRDETLDITEHAALSAVCLAILNLDESLTRE